MTEKGFCFVNYMGYRLGENIINEWRAVISDNFINFCSKLLNIPLMNCEGIVLF